MKRKKIIKGSIILLSMLFVASTASIRVSHAAATPVPEPTPEPSKAIGILCEACFGANTRPRRFRGVCSGDAPLGGGIHLQHEPKRENDEERSCLQRVSGSGTVDENAAASRLGQHGTQRSRRLNPQSMTATHRMSPPLPHWRMRSIARFNPPPPNACAASVRSSARLRFCFPPRGSRRCG